MILERAVMSISDVKKKQRSALPRGYADGTLVAMTTVVYIIIDDFNLLVLCPVC